ncbi:MAG: hypothetical protein IJR68_08540 [Fretibacterium sp.]|nr:hypothetical protein [Fretibacterium sp.]
MTRTRNVDYRVLEDGGRTALPSDAFASLYRKGNILPDKGEACAVLFQEDGKVYLVASALQRGIRDVHGRPIRFSFCRILQGTAQQDRGRAFVAFARLVRDWEGTEERMRSLIRETPHREGRGEDIEFDERTFMDWLEGDETRAISFRECTPREVLSVSMSSPVWPPEGYMLKWERAEDDCEIIPSLAICLPTGRQGEGRT